MSDTAEPAVEPRAAPPKCQNCIYWKQTTMPMGDCYAEPPQFVGPLYSLQQRRPEVKNTDYCRYFSTTGPV